MSSSSPGTSSTVHDINKEAALQKKEEGNKAYNEKRFQEALELYDEAIQLDHTRISYYNNKGAVYIEQLEFQLAKDVCNEALKVGETHGASDKNISRSLARIGKAYWMLGDVYTAMWKYEEAVLKHTSQSLLDEQNQVYGAVKKALLESDTPSAEKLLAAGDMIKRIYCDRKISYETLYEHPIMFPPAPQQTYVDAFTEVDTSSKCLKEKEQQFQYEAECDLYSALQDLKSVTRKIIVLHNLKFSKEQARVFMNDCKSSLGEGEHDFVVIVRNMGIVLFEVKAPVEITDGKFKRNFEGSRKQLKRVAELIDCICKTWDIDQSVTKKVFRFTAFPRTSREQVADFQSYQKLPVAVAKQIIFQDDIRHFSNWWFYNVFIDLEEEVDLIGQLESTILGLWCINQNNICDIDICSLGYCITQIDNALKSELISRNVSAPISKNIKGSPPVFRNYLDLKCLTQEQIDIFKNGKPCQFIIGPAGSGKTILLLGKIIELAKKGKTCLLFSGSYQYEKYQKIFTEAGLVSHFLYKVVDDGHVCIVDIDPSSILSDFGCVYICYYQNDTVLRFLQKFEELTINVFIDDLHGMLNLIVSEFSENGLRDEAESKIKLLSDIILCMKSAVDNNISNIFWVIFDHMQLTENRISLSSGDTITIPNPNLVENCAIREYLLREYSSKYWMPLFDILEKECVDTKDLFRFLTRNLRNTVEIDRLVEHLRYRSFCAKVHGFFSLLPKIVTGHFIHGPKPSLIYISKTDATNELLFQVIHEELYKLLKIGDNRLEPKDVAVLDGSSKKISGDSSTSGLKAMYASESIIKEMSGMLVTEFGDVTIQLLNSSALQSSEWKAVIMILNSSNMNFLYIQDPSHYMEDPWLFYLTTVSGFADYFHVGMTRARTYISIIVVEFQEGQYLINKVLEQFGSPDTIFKLITNNKVAKSEAK